MRDHELGEIYEKKQKKKQQKTQAKNGLLREKTTKNKPKNTKKELERHKWRSALSKKLTRSEMLINLS